MQTGPENSEMSQKNGLLPHTSLVGGPFGHPTPKPSTPMGWGSLEEA